MPADFIPATIVVGSTYRVRQTFYPSNVPLAVGTVVRIDWDRVRVEERIYERSIGLTPLDPPGGTIIWVRSHPLNQAYFDQILGPCG